MKAEERILVSSHSYACEMNNLIVILINDHSIALLSAGYEGMNYNGILFL